MPEPEPACEQVPAIGDDILFRGQPAKVISVHAPGGPDAMVDLVVYHGLTSEVTQQVRHNPATGWCWPDEAPKLPPSLEEKLLAARRSGKRIPKVGETVWAISASFDSVAEVPYFATRSKVLAVKDIFDDRVAIDLAMYENPEPPEDPRQPDPVKEWFTTQGALGPLSPEQRAVGWTWPDSGWKSPPRLTAEERAPKEPCTRCGTPFPHSSRVEILANARFNGWEYSVLDRSKPVAQLCHACADSVLTFATTAPPDPAVVLSPDRAEKEAAHVGA